MLLNWLYWQRHPSSVKFFVLRCLKYFSVNWLTGCSKRKAFLNAKHHHPPPPPAVHIFWPYQSRMTPYLLSQNLGKTLEPVKMSHCILAPKYTVFYILSVILEYLYMLLTTKLLLCFLVKIRNFNPGCKNSIIWMLGSHWCRSFCCQGIKFSRVDSRVNSFNNSLDNSKLKNKKTACLITCKHN